MKQLIVGLLLSCMFTCTAQNKFLSYNMAKPIKKLSLDKELKEISGLSYVDSNTLLAVQDELGTIFQLNPNTGEIVNRIQFESKGDFEGIAKVGDSYFILKSDGDIYKVNKGIEVNKSTFDHNKKMDFEGLCYDKKNNQLLVACKESKKKGDKDEIFVYSYNIDKLEYNKKAYINIDRDQVDDDFKPSGITIHPNGTILIISSFSKSLLAITPKEKIIQKTKINMLLFQQPEGITIDDNGRLYISNEKKGIDQNILIF